VLLQDPAADQYSESDRAEYRRDLVRVLEVFYDKQEFGDRCRGRVGASVRMSQGVLEAEHGN